MSERHPKIPPNSNKHFRPYNPCVKPILYCFVPNATKMASWVVNSKLDRHRKIIVACVAAEYWLVEAARSWNKDEEHAEANMQAAEWRMWGNLGDILK